MIVLDGFRINPPYDTVVGAPGQVSGLERVIKVVSILYLQLHSQLFSTLILIQFIVAMIAYKMTDYLLILLEFNH